MKHTRCSALLNPSIRRVQPSQLLGKKVNVGMRGPFFMTELQRPYSMQLILEDFSLCNHIVLNHITSFYRYTLFVRYSILAPRVHPVNWAIKVLENLQGIFEKKNLFEWNSKKLQKQFQVTSILLFLLNTKKLEIPVNNVSWRSMMITHRSCIPNSDEPYFKTSWLLSQLSRG